MIDLKSVTDLIDTLWNVKRSVNIVIDPSRSDLIDTLWNVKTMKKLDVDLRSRGFNRYIVECKDHTNKTHYYKQK